MKKHIGFFLILFGILHPATTFCQDDFAVIYLYRPKNISGAGSMIRVHFKDQLVATFKTGSLMKYKIYSEGVLAIKSQRIVMGNTVPGENNLTVEIKNGNNYYVKLYSDDLRLMDGETGKSEFEDGSYYKESLVEKEEDTNIPLLALKSSPKKEQGQQDNLYTESQYRGSGDPMKGLHMTAPSEMVIGSYYALIIGIDNYKGAWPPLKNAVSDAKAIESLIKSRYKFDVVKVLYNEQANRSNIIKEMEWLVNTVKPQDNVLIYYSGHGEFKKELNKGYWVPVEAMTKSTSEYLSNNDLQTYIGGIRSLHTLLVADACFSGDIFRGTTVSIPFEESDKYYRLVHSKTSRQAITSGGLEPVMDGGRDGHSVFAYYLLKSLNTNAAKYYDASQMYSDIKIGVINNSNQTPIFNPVKDVGDEGGQFVFIKK